MRVEEIDEFLNNLNLICESNKKKKSEIIEEPSLNQDLDSDWLLEDILNSLNDDEITAYAFQGFL